MAPTLQTASAASAAAVSAVEQRLENQQTVRAFYDLAFTQRRPNEAAARCVALPRMADGLRPNSAQAHLAAVVGWVDSLPGLKVEVRNVVADGDLVAVQSVFTPAPEERAMLVLDLFRLRDGRIVEHWDALQELQDPTRQVPLQA